MTNFCLYASYHINLYIHFMCNNCEFFLSLAKLLVFNSRGKRLNYNNERKLLCKMPSLGFH